MDITNIWYYQYGGIQFKISAKTDPFMSVLFVKPLAVEHTVPLPSWNSLWDPLKPFVFKGTLWTQSLGLREVNIGTHSQMYTENTWHFNELQVEKSFLVNFTDSATKWCWISLISPTVILTSCNILHIFFVSWSIPNRHLFHDSCYTKHVDY